MKKCPTCGNRYRPDVEVCPNDGTSLAPGPPPAPAPPPGGPPTAPRPKPKPASPSFSYDDISTGLTEKSTATSWIVSLLVCGLLIGGYFIARDYMLAKNGEGDEIVEAPDSKDSKKKRKKRKGKRRRNNNGSPGEENFDDYDWEQDFVEDDLVLGDIRSQPDEYVEVEPQIREPEPYNPTREEYQADGSYRPTAGWSKPGAKANVVEIDLNAPSNASPLDESAIKRVLNVRQLAPCYDPWVQKIPQMRGRVHMDFVVDGNGKVISVEITRSQLRSRVVEECIVKRARGFRFPSAPGGAKTRFDTHFDFTNR